MEIQDLKIRFSGEGSEHILAQQIEYINSHDWENQPIGQHNFHVSLLRRVDTNEYVGQIAFYRTKTQRVVYISTKNHK